jgi:hypothetical protein
MILLTDLLREDIIEKSSVIPTITEALPVIQQLGNKTMLTREFQGIRSGAAKITSGPIDKGRIGTAINPNSPVYLEDIANAFKTIINQFSLKHIIYCSHGNVRFNLAGPQYYMIPIGKYKTVWSEQVKDIYADAMSLKKAGKLDEFPVDSYKNKWPVGNVNEVLVDCVEYYLISINIPIVQDYMKKKKLGTYNRTKFIPNKIETYSQLHDILKDVVMQYKN